MQRPGLLNERNFYPKSILAKEKIVYTYSKIINCSKFFTPTRKKKANFHSKKKCLMLTQKHAQKESFFQTKQYFTLTWKNQFSAWKNSYTYLKKKSVEIISPPEKNFLYYHRKSNFPTEQYYHTFQKKSDFRRKKHLTFVRKKLKVSYTPPPHPNWRQFRRRKFFFRVHKIFRTQVFAGIVVFSFCF